MRSVQLALIIAATGALAALAPQLVLEPIADALTEVTVAMDQLPHLGEQIQRSP